MPSRNHPGLLSPISPRCIPGWRESRVLTSQAMIMNSTGTVRPIATSRHMLASRIVLEAGCAMGAVVSNCGYSSNRGHSGSGVSARTDAKIIAVSLRDILYWTTCCRTGIVGEMNEEYFGLGQGTGFAGRYVADPPSPRLRRTRCCAQFGGSTLPPHFYQTKPVVMFMKTHL